MILTSNDRIKHLEYNLTFDFKSNRVYTGIVGSEIDVLILEDSNCPMKKYDESFYSKRELMCQIFKEIYHS